MRSSGRSCSPRPWCRGCRGRCSHSPAASAMRGHAIEVGREVRRHGGQHRGVHAAEKGVLHLLVLPLIGQGWARLPRGAWPGQSTIWSSRPRHRAPPRPAAHRDAGWCTVSGSPETSGCHQAGPCPRPAGDRRRSAAASRSRRPFGVSFTQSGTRGGGSRSPRNGSFDRQQPAGDVGEDELVRLVVAQLVQAAAAAAVAKAFPFGAGHRVERLGLPEGFFG